MFRNWLILALMTVLVGFVATVSGAGEPGGEDGALAVEEAPVEAPGDEGSAEDIEVEGMEAPTFLATGITCTFHCSDGFGFGYDCPHPTLGQCCAAAQPACASHGGLESGICSNGRLGLSCVPFDT